MNGRILIVDDEEVLREAVAEKLRHSGHEVQTAESAEKALAGMAEFDPHLIVTDLRMDGMTGLDLLAKVKEVAAQVDVVVITGHEDMETAVTAMKAGAFDYLVKPVTEKALASALNRTEESEKHHFPENAPEQKARIAVIGSRGGVGASTLALNLAWILAEERKYKTALVDLDLEFGTVALSLDLEPTRGLREALENPARVDGLFIASATAKLTEKLSIMATEENLTAEVQFNPNAVDALFEALGRTNEAIVVDVPRTSYAVRRRVFEAATEIVLVTELSLSGLRDSLRLLRGIQEVAPDKPVHVVANRSLGPKQAMQLKDFQKALEHKVNLVLPDEPKVFNAAANTGKPLAQTNGRAKVCKALRKFAGDLQLPEQDEEEVKGKGKAKTKVKMKRGAAAKSKKPGDKKKSGLFGLFKRG